MSSLMPSGRDAVGAHHPSLATAPTVVREAVTADASALAKSSANAVIIGDPFAVRRALTTIWLSLRKPVVWTAGTRLSLPLGPCGTLILEAGNRLSESDQAALLTWLDEDGRSVRVLTTSPQPLSFLVDAGSFLESLYARLDGLHVGTDEPLADVPGPGVPGIAGPRPL